FRSSSSTDSTPGSAFMDEFYAECDDHITQVRRTLLALEEKLGQPGLDPALFDKVFQRFHSLKGICGMAGLQGAEALAHRTEDYLRALRSQEASFTTEGFD